MSMQLLHISDSHLYSDPSALLKGICPHDSFAAVLADAYQRYPDIDGLILGGDMAQDERAETYALLATMLPHWRAPVMISPGNHACLPHLNQVLVPALHEHSSYRDHLQAGGWQVITLNSHHAGHIAGLLPQRELDRLQQLLSSHRTEHTLIALHHHPLPIGSRWLDAIGLENRDRLWQIITQYPQVRALISGHIHQPFDTTHQGIRVLGSPSTSVQFTPGKDNFALDATSPGYRWLELLDDGSIHTGIQRINGFIPPDLLNNIPY